MSFLRIRISRGMKRNRPPSWDVYCYSCNCQTCQGRDVYVGTAKWGTAERHHAHIRSALKIIVDPSIRGPQAFHHFIAKHGVDNLEIRTLQSCSTREEMYDLEIKFILELKTLSVDGGMNIHRGGKGGRISCSDETKEKISQALKKSHDENPHLHEITWAGRDAWLKASPGNASLRAKLAWETKRRRAKADPEYAKNLHEAAVRRGNLSKDARVARDKVQ